VSSNASTALAHTAEQRPSSVKPCSFCGRSAAGEDGAELARIRKERDEALRIAAAHEAKVAELCSRLASLERWQKLAAPTIELVRVLQWAFDHGSQAEYEASKKAVLNARPLPPGTGEMSS